MKRNAVGVGAASRPWIPKGRTTFVADAHRGGGNAANGVAALYFNTPGTNNTVDGFEALFINSTGGSNMADGIARAHPAVWALG